MKITYLGQEGFLIEYKDTRFLTDPYLSDYVDRNSAIKDFEWIRAYAPPMTVCELGNIDAVFLTHDHDDHTDPDTTAEINKEKKNAKFIISESKTRFLNSLGVPLERIEGVQCFKEYSFGDISVIPIPAAHEELHESPEYGEDVFDELGYIFILGDVTLFHAGDTYDYEGMAELINKYKRENTLVTLLPVNGADEERRAKGIAGNLDCHEAFDLAKRCNADLIIPMHHDLYPKNGVSNEEIIKTAEADKVENVRILSPGECFEIV